MISGQAGVVYVMENPVISRALQDIMGMDQGVPVYGETGHLNYVFAVQNGGAPMISVYI